MRFRARGRHRRGLPYTFTAAGGVTMTVPDDVLYEDALTFAGAVLDPGAVGVGMILDTKRPGQVRVIRPGSGISWEPR